MATGRYYRITPRFWQDKDIRQEWTEDMRMLALYLLTSPHRNMIGLYHLPPAYAMADLQWDEKRFRDGFETLQERLFIEYDSDSQVLLIPNVIRYDPPSNDNQVVGALNALANVPPSPLIMRFADACDKAAAKLDDEKQAKRCAILAERIRNRFEAESQPNRNGLETVSKPFPNRSETDSKPNRTTVTDTDTDTASASATVSEPSPEPVEAEEASSASPGQSVPYVAIVDAYHNLCDGWPKVTTLTPPRKKILREWWSTFGQDLHKFRLAFKRAGESDFLSGRNGHWKAGAPCDLDWLLKESNLAAVLEGRYDNRSKAPPAPPERPVDTRSMLELIILAGGDPDDGAEVPF